jgi:hypothetical protein
MFHVKTLRDKGQGKVLHLKHSFRGNGNPQNCYILLYAEDGNVLL